MREVEQLRYKYEQYLMKVRNLSDPEVNKALAGRSPRENVSEVLEDVIRRLKDIESAELEKRVLASVMRIEAAARENQKQYLENMITQGGKNAIWAAEQLKELIRKRGY